MLEDTFGEEPTTSLSEAVKMLTEATSGFGHKGKRVRLGRSR